MPSVNDVAAYLLQVHGPMTTMKVQKLVYYCQAWSVVWDDDVLFPETIEAWDKGPVVRALWEKMRGQFRMSTFPDGDPSALSDNQKQTVQKVLDYYGPRDAQWLSDLTHMEDPWRDAFERGQNTEITPLALMEYYANLPANEPA